MRTPRWLHRASQWPIYPFLAAAYPVVFLYGQNVEQAIRPFEWLLPLAVSLAAAVVSMVIFRFASGDWSRAALITTVLVALFFTYGLAWDWIGGLLVGHWVLIVAWLLIGVSASAAIWRRPDLTRKFTTGLNAAGALLLLVNVILIGSFFLNLRVLASGGVSGVTASGQGGEPVHRPDVYWLILEEYGSGSVLKNDFKYDNTPFLDELRKRGFYIADEATANYLKTGHSVASSRNMEYLDGPELLKEAHEPDDWGPIYADLQGDFEVHDYLERLGYSYIYMGTFWQPMAISPVADINYVYDKLASEFIDVLERATMLRAFESLGTQAPYDWRRNRYNQTLWELQALDRASELPGPKFVHGQFALDHEPYVFHPDGSFISVTDERTGPHEKVYIDQLQYTNTQMLAWIDKVLAVPPDQRPIIIMQADEGPWPPGYRRNERGFDWTSASADDLKEKFGILSAFYVPGKTPTQAGLYPSITPVNQFRALFDAYFGLKLPLLPDRNYIWPNQSEIYDLIDVSARVRPPG
jgi:hypothetical protein